jgi:hypothetical protein
MAKGDQYCRYFHVKRGSEKFDDISAYDLIIRKAAMSVGMVQKQKHLEDLLEAPFTASPDWY